MSTNLNLSMKYRYQSLKYINTNTAQEREFWRAGLGKIWWKHAVRGQRASTFAQNGQNTTSRRKGKRGPSESKWGNITSRRKGKGGLP